MKLFLTSDPFLPKGGINEDNDFLWNLKYSLPYETNALYVAASYHDPLINDRIANGIKDTFNTKGIFFKNMEVLDARNAGMTKDEIQAHNLIILGDGNAADQYTFFKAINLRSKLEGYDGTILAIGSGSLNSAEEVYLLTGKDGEAEEEGFQRFCSGLSLTKIKIIPHYDATIGKNVDGMNQLDRIRIDNKNRLFLGLSDGSYMVNTDGQELIHGPFYRIENRNFTKVEASFMPKSLN